MSFVYNLVNYISEPLCTIGIHLITSICQDINERTWTPSVMKWHWWWSFWSLSITQLTPPNRVSGANMHVTVHIVNDVVAFTDFANTWKCALNHPLWWFYSYLHVSCFLVIIKDFFGCLFAFMPTNGLPRHQVLCMFTRHVYTKAIRPWLLRILEFSLIEKCYEPPL